MSGGGARVNGSRAVSSGGGAVPPPSTEEFNTFWFSNFQHGEQVEFSSFISALTLHFNSAYSSPLFTVLPLPSQHKSTRGRVTFFPLLINSLLFLCIPGLASCADPPPPPQTFAVGEEGAEGLEMEGEERPSVFIRRAEVEAFISTFGGQLRTAFHIAHFSLFDNTGALYQWFHGHDRCSVDLQRVAQSQQKSMGGEGSFLVRCSQSRVGALTVLQCVEGKWSPKRYLTCTEEGWTATSQSDKDGRYQSFGVFPSIHSYLSAHHAHQTPIVSTLSSLFTSTVSPSEAVVLMAGETELPKSVRPPSPTAPPTPISSTSDDTFGSGTLESSVSTPSLPTPSATGTTPATAQLLPSTVAAFPTSPSPGLSSYQLLSGYPIVLGCGIPPPDSPSRASTTASCASACPPSPVHSDASSGDVDMASDGDDSSAHATAAAVSSIPAVTGASSYALHLFFYAIAVDDVLAVRTFIRLRCVPLTASDDFGLTCVHIACAFNRVRILHLLKAVVPVTMLAAVTIRRISHLDDHLLTAFTVQNRHMPYFRTQLVLEKGSPCGSIACGYQSGGCLTLIQQWVQEYGLKVDSLGHETLHTIANE